MQRFSILALARNALGHRSANHTLQPTALVNDAYLKLAGSAGDFEGRSHFYGVAAKVMRQILADHARAKGRQKRGGEWHRVTLNETDGATPDTDVDLLALDESLTQLAALRPDYARIVELRFFGGLTLEEIADHLGQSHATVRNHWRTARAWLRVSLDQAAS